MSDSVNILAERVGIMLCLIFGRDAELLVTQLVQSSGELLQLSDILHAFYVT